MTGIKPLACELCGTPVRVMGDNEGTNWYEPVVPAVTPETLDVERLARAFFRWSGWDGSAFRNAKMQEAREHAADIAREYAALAPSPEPEPPHLGGTFNGSQLVENPAQPQAPDLRAAASDMLQEWEDGKAIHVDTVRALRAALRDSEQPA